MKITVFICLDHAGFPVKVLSLYLLTSSQMEFCDCSAPSLIYLFTTSVPSLFYFVSGLCVCLPLLAMIIKDLIKPTSFGLDFVELAV